MIGEKAMQVYLEPLDKLKSAKIVEAFEALKNPPAAADGKVRRQHTTLHAILIRAAGRTAGCSTSQRARLRPCPEEGLRPRASGRWKGIFQLDFECFLSPSLAAQP